MSTDDRVAVHDLLVGYCRGIGGSLTGEAAQADAGWRLSRLGLDLVWTDGDPPGRASA